LVQEYWLGFIRNGLIKDKEYLVVDPTYLGGIMMSIVKYTQFFLIFSFFISTTSYADFDMVLNDVEVRGGVVANINIEVFESDAPICQKLTTLSENSDVFSFILNKASIFAVHGALLNGTFFQPLAQALFTDNPTGSIVCRVVAMDQPGHGGSGLPENGILFGELSVTDYANVLLNTLETLSSDFNISPKSIIAHSTGGLVVQVAQQMLVDEGSSLRDRFDIRRLTLFASVPSAPVVWPLAQATADALTFTANCFSGPGIPFLPGCEVLDLDPPGGDGDVDWDDVQALDPFNTIFDCDPNTVPVGIDVAPDNCEEPSIRGDRFPAGALGGSDEEPLNIAREINGVPPQVRPSTNAGIFSGSSNGLLQIVAFENDEIIGPPKTLEDLFLHLTNNTILNNRYQLVTGELSNHVMIFFNPVEVLNALAGNTTLP